jgi:hypothetical protein
MVIKKLKRPETQKQRNILLSDRLIDKARTIGGGNISMGVRRALEEFVIDEAEALLMEQLKALRARQGLK